MDYKLKKFLSVLHPHMFLTLLDSTNWDRWTCNAQTQTDLSLSSLHVLPRIIGMQEPPVY